MDKEQYESEKKRTSRFEEGEIHLSSVQRAAHGLMDEGKVYVAGVDLFPLLSKERSAYWRVELMKMLNTEAEIIKRNMEAI